MYMASRLVHGAYLLALTTKVFSAGYKHSHTYVLMRSYVATN